MPRSVWLRRVAVRGCLIAGVALLFAGVGSSESREPTSALERQKHAPVESDNDQPSNKEQTDRRPDAISPSTALPWWREAEGSTPAGKDDHSTYYDREDLIAQRSMADATLELVDITWRQFVVGIFESVLLIATVMLSLWAARAASRATKAAEETVQETRKNAVAEMRAYIGIERIYASPPRNDSPPAIIVHVKNFGSSPAFNVAHKVRNDLFLKGEEEFDLSKGKNLSVLDIAPGQSTYPTFPASEKTWPITLAIMNEPNKHLYIFGTITYEDVFGNGHQPTTGSGCRS